ncbi:MAG: hypothetical protein ACYC99_07480 [Candidatus Geothermincolia bacterium]
MLRRVLALIVALLLTAGILAVIPVVALAPPVTYPNWFLAEGSNAWGFSTTITIENPNAVAVTCDVTFMTVAGPITGPVVNCPALSMTNLTPDALPADRDFSTGVFCREGLTIAVERTMVWPYADPMVWDLHASIGVTSPAIDWYLPEGSSAWGFECWLLIQNPNDFDAHCQVTYMIEGAGPQTINKLIPANSRQSYNMFDDIGARDASIMVHSTDYPVIPERAMYKNHRRGGHESIGTTTPATDYYLAEGTTGFGFTTYVLVQNPNPTATDVTVTYMTTTGPETQPVFTMPGNSRKTIRVNDVLPDTDLSTKVHGTQPIIAERAMYWDGGSGYGDVMHDSIGMPAPHKSFYLPYGKASWRPSYTDMTYTLVQNPNPTPVDVRISYLMQGGTGNVVFDDTIAGNSRKTYSLNERMSPGGGEASVVVLSMSPGLNVMAEIATYWTDGIARRGGTSTIGGFSD